MTIMEKERRATISWERVEAAGKAMLAVAALIYAVGVLIVSSDLAQFHITLFSLARPQYILVGAAWLLISIASFAMPCFSGWFLRNAVKLRSIRGILWIAFSLSISCYVSLKIVFSISERPYDYWFLVGLYIALDLMTYYFAWSISDSFIKSRASSLAISPDAIPRWLNLSFGGLTMMIPLGLWTAFYMNIIYPNLLPNYGGGKHPSAVVVFRSPEKGDLNQLQRSLSPIVMDGLSTEGEVLILAADEDFVVLGYPSRTIERPKYKIMLVNKGLIASIRYE